MKMVAITEKSQYFTPGGVPLYVGDTGDKFAYFEKESLTALGVDIELHGKMPDVIIHDTERKWLVLVEAVTSHGPINPKRRGELKRLFTGCKAGLVYVTAFLTRRARQATSVLACASGSCRMSRFIQIALFPVWC